ncbi:MAG: hypothetical protein P8J50_14215 [Acidimicrobiales bacterium]|nr:hypothetical protein [Acidimicrobiales bacterium]
MSDFASPLVDENDALRFRRWVIATVVSAVVVSVGTALALKSFAPVDQWPAAFGLGAMVGFWLCPLTGAVIGNGYHESLQSREKLLSEQPAPETPQPAAGTAIPLPAVS